VLYRRTPWWCAALVACPLCRGAGITVETCGRSSSGTTVETCGRSGSGSSTTVETCGGRGRGSSTTVETCGGTGGAGGTTVETCGGTGGAGGTTVETCARAKLPHCAYTPSKLKTQFEQTKPSTQQRQCIHAFKTQNPF